MPPEAEVARHAPTRVFETDGGGDYVCAVHPDLHVAPERWTGVRGGVLVADVAAHARVARYLEGDAAPASAVWRSGVKHDCARVMELQRRPEGLVNGWGELVDIEPDCVYPLRKSSDLGPRGSRVERHVIVTQRSLGDDTEALRRSAPRTWAYLERHAERLDGRKSVIYRGRPRFSIFGIGDYAFAPWKVAVSGLYKRATFALVGPSGGKPVMCDDTCYFLGFSDPDEAALVRDLCMGEVAQALVSAFAFWDAKRPINKDVLTRLDVAVLARAALQVPGLDAKRRGMLERLAAARRLQGDDWRYAVNPR